MATLRQDLGFAARVLRRSPGFALVAVATIAVGIAGPATVFSVMNALLLRPLPFPEPERIVTLSESVGEGAEIQERNFFSYPRYLQYRDADHGLAGFAAEGVSQHILSGDLGARPIASSYVSANYFGLLGVQPALGRFFSAEEDRVPGASPVAVVSYDVWQSDFGGDPSVLGRSLILDRQTATVIGVAPHDFAGLPFERAPDLWLPVSMYGHYHGSDHFLFPGGMSWLTVFGRLGPDESREAAEARVSGISLALGREHQAQPPAVGASLHRLGLLHVRNRDQAARYLVLMLGMSGLVLLIAAANVGGMLLARATARRQEIAVRRAIGAGRGRLIRQLLVETGVIFLLGAGLGLLLASGAIRVIAGMQGLPVPVPNEILIDLWVILLALGLSLISSLLFGLAPALRASRPELVSDLKLAGPAGNAQKTRLRSVFVVGQVALSLVLLIAAGLLLRALQEALRTDLGFDPDRVVTMQLWLPDSEYDAARRAVVSDELVERIRNLPSVEAASLGTFLPVPGASGSVHVELPSSGEPSSAMVRTNWVGPDYFRTLAIPVLRGREFLDSTTGGEGEVILNLAAARLLVEGDPLGMEVRTMGAGDVVVGVVGDVRQDGFSEEAVPMIYLPHRPQSEMTLHVRTSAPTGSLLPVLQEAVTATDPNIQMINVSPLSDVVAAQLQPQRVSSVLIGILGLIGLGLAALGIYGILTFDVAQRTREIGVRMALGASAAGLARMISRRAAVLVVVGSVIGVVAGVAAGRLLEALLLGLSPADPVALGAVLALLIAVAVVASYLPARRASRVDPMIALRAE